MKVTFKAAIPLLLIFMAVPFFFIFPFYNLSAETNSSGEIINIDRNNNNKVKTSDGLACYLRKNSEVLKKKSSISKLRISETVVKESMIQDTDDIYMVESLENDNMRCHIY